MYECQKQIQRCIFVAMCRGKQYAGRGQRCAVFTYLLYDAWRKTRAGGQCCDVFEQPASQCLGKKNEIGIGQCSQIERGRVLCQQMIA